MDDLKLAMMKRAIREALPQGAGDYTVTSVAQAAMKAVEQFPHPLPEELGDGLLAKALFMLSRAASVGVRNHPIEKLGEEPAPVAPLESMETINAAWDHPDDPSWPAYRDAAWIPQAKALKEAVALIAADSAAVNAQKRRMK